jgi:hypothetical protein
VEEEGVASSVRALMLGRVASFYYLKHATMGHLSRALGPGMALPAVRPHARLAAPTAASTSLLSALTIVACRVWR